MTHLSNAPAQGATSQTQNLAKSLQLFRPKGLLNICTIIPDGALTGRTFLMPDEKSACVEFIQTENQAGKNIYWTVNPVKQRVAKKPRKQDIKVFEWVHADIDPPLTDGYEQGRQHLLESCDELFERYHPTMLVDSGNGLQLFWRLKEPASIQEGELLNRKAIQLFKGDPGTGNADRLMRMPFTQNYPTQAKLAKGYPPSAQKSILLHTQDKQTGLPQQLMDVELLDEVVTEAARLEDDEVFPVNPTLWKNGGKKAWSAFLRKQSKLQALWNYETVPDDHSATLMTLLNHLAFYAGNNTKVMRKVFESSAFCQCDNIVDKWCNEHHQLEGIAFSTYHLRKARQDHIWEATKEETSTETLSKDTFSEWTDTLTLSIEEAEALSDPEWIVENLIIRGHMIAFPAEPNAGKTTLFMHLSEQLAKDYQVFYINVDISGTDAKSMVGRADRAGFKLLLPDMKNTSPKEVLNKIQGLSQSGEDLSNYLFIIDTLKKFADVINKSNLKNILGIFRALTARGATVCLLAHTNKYKDENGNPTYEGTGDLRSDVDELIYLIPVKNDDGTITLSTKPDKVRGMFEPITYTLHVNRTVTSCQQYIDTTKKRNELEAAKKYKQTIDFILDELRTGEKSQSDLIEAGKEHGISKNEIRQVLDRFCGDKAEVRYFDFIAGKNNTYYYFEYAHWME